MTKAYVVLSTFASFCVAGMACAEVNIVYPINGAHYPITTPAPEAVNAAYFTSSFSVTCAGDHKVQWGFDNSPAIGSSTFYDQTSVQFVHKLPGGQHLFWVRSNCGEKRVNFKIAPPIQD